MFTYSKIFRTLSLTGAFDFAINADAENGRVNSAFLNALQLDYGLVNQAAAEGCNLAQPGQFVRFVSLIAERTKDNDVGAKAGIRPAVMQAIHACAVVLHASGKGMRGATLLALPNWANPESIAAAKAVKAAAKKAADKAAQKAQQGTESDAGDVESEDGTEGSAQAVAPDVGAAVNLVIAAAQGGHLTSAQRVLLLAALQTAPTTADSAGDVVDVQAREVALID